MLVRIMDFLRKLVPGSPEEVQEVAVPEEKKAFSIPHVWPFPSPRPTNEEYLVGELIKGVKTEGDHVFLYWNGKKRRHIRTPEGKETVLAKHIVWWMEGRKAPTGSLTTNCGEAKCIKLSHLVLKAPQIPYGPPNRPKPVMKPQVTYKANVPPLPPEIKPGHKTTLERFTYAGREKCVSRKDYFETMELAEEQASWYNRPQNRGTDPRQFAYQCEEIGCGGYHLSKIDPKKFGKHRKKLGAW